MKTDVCKFINSKSVARYLREIKYDFSALEAAYIVWQSQYATLREKFEAWEDIIASMPDTEIKKRRSYDRQPSLHSFLTKYIELTKQNINEFYRCDGAAYSYQLLFKGDTVWYDEKHLFSSVDLCMKDIIKVVENDEIECYYIKKQILNSEHSVLALFNDKHEIRSISVDRTESNGEIIDFFGLFDSLWFQIPTPFKRGDLVYLTGKWVDWNVEPKTPFVLLEISSWGEKELKENGITSELYIAQQEKRSAILKDMGDSSDMCATGYFIDERNNVYWDHNIFETYLNLEYYDEKLPEKQSILYDISKYIKGEISFEALSSKYELSLEELKTIQTNEFNSLMNNKLI